MELLQKLIQIAGQGEYPCLFYLITGAYCPGCGGTRALRALLHGQLLMSFWYHPLVPYLALSLPLFLLYWFFCIKIKKPLATRVWKTVLYAGIIILVSNFLVKNYLLIFGGTDLLTILDQVSRP